MSAGRFTVEVEMTTSMTAPLGCVVNGVGFASTPILYFAPGRRMTLQPLKLTAGAQATVVATDGSTALTTGATANGKPLGGVRVRFSGSGFDGGASFSAEDYTDVTGTLRFDGLPGGIFTIEAAERANAPLDAVDLRAS